MTVQTNPSDRRGRVGEPIPGVPCLACGRPASGRMVPAPNGNRPGYRHESCTTRTRSHEREIER